jgi:PAS domain S-box-containing protein
MHERYETDQRRLNGRGEPVWDATLVRDSDRGVVAADDTNRIVAVSRPLAALLGWQVDDLVGRRVVTLIPPALREAHVAGFSRHLSTGEAHVLGRPVDLPVLRSDGTQVMCRFLVERAPTNPGRSVYVAWISPLEE